MNDQDLTEGMTADEPPRRRWHPISRLDPTTVPLNGSQAALAALRQEWERELTELSDDEAKRRRQRTLRRLALETGIIERLYDIDWGVSLTLVAEGFAKEVIERAGGRVDDRTLATLVAQRDALEIVVDFVGQNRQLSPSFIKELHQAITRTQATYLAVDPLGRAGERELPRGQWKQWPNHVLRADGSILEYCPPEHVASEVDHLCDWYEDLEHSSVHPMVTAAWLHHRFVQIHPFADGNGRVARALTLLVMQRHRYAPLVIDRFHRDAYIDALEHANEGDLTPIVRLFVSLESASLASELERIDEPERGTSNEVARTLAAQLAHRRHQQETRLRKEVEVRARAIMGRCRHWFEVKREEIEQVFRSQGVYDVRIDFFPADTPDARAMYFRRQAIDSAHRAGHYADFNGFVGLVNLRTIVAGLRLSFLASLHGVGRSAGVMAVTTFGVISSSDPDPNEAPEAPQDIVTSSDAFHFVHTETLDQLEQRSGELETLLDDGLSVALAELLQRI